MSFPKCPRLMYTNREVREVEESFRGKEITTNRNLRFVSNIVLRLEASPDIISNRRVPDSIFLPRFRVFRSWFRVASLDI